MQIRMKNIVKNLCVASILAGSLTGCTGDFEEMNKNPLQTTEVSPALLFPIVLQEGFNNRWDNYQLGENLHSNQYCQYIANTTSYFSSDRYAWNDGWVSGGYWDPYYTSVMKDYRIVEEQIKEKPEYTNLFQIMRIYTAMCTAKMTDLFGDIPYSNAATGEQQPSFDSQKDIYYNVFKELTEAVEILQSGLSLQTNYGESDYMFRGDEAKWIKFANSLRLRFAIRLSFVDPVKAKTEGEAALAAGVMSNASDKAELETNKDYSTGLGFPMYTLCYWNEFRMSKTMENIMKNTSSVEDPRLPVWFGMTESFNKGTSAVKFQGVRNGLPSDQTSLDGNKAADNSNIWGLAFAPTWNSEGIEPAGWLTYPHNVMNYAEVCFLKAEAAIRGWNGAGSAKANYEEGIRQSFASARWNINTALLDITKDETYITTGKVAWDESADFEGKLERIITQKWIALFPNGNEAWAECRRTGYPKLTPVVQSDESTINPSNGEFIKKLRYTDDEKRINEANATSSSLNSGQGDGLSVRVWWDTKRYK